ncbi:hypothetical protein EVAR_78941_1 [Eumeta japonica]|uniref:Uncharacterized protein n=1 Tax=Eumeta variegata TaxID=151549 RepID=A0A4C1U2M6_EUMVA|nr:hypothetical protein EVAR_78941_1 [Eumeta japonica]
MKEERRKQQRESHQNRFISFPVVHSPYIYLRWPSACWAIHISFEIPMDLVRCVETRWSTPPMDLRQPGEVASAWSAFEEGRFLRFETIVQRCSFIVIIRSAPDKFENYSSVQDRELNPVFLLKAAKSTTGLFYISSFRIKIFRDEKSLRECDTLYRLAFSI